ncbi:lysine-specific permease [Martensiomyces pterosporus]|nr:lysine-specific permease [Martensiomyces pterosporus]
MIALGGTIGTGLFISAGTSLATAGPGGALVSYLLMGVIVFFLMSSLGEVATFTPIAGSFNEYASRYGDPAIGFALGWNYWFNYVCVTASELVASGIVMQNYLPHINGVLWSLIAAVILLALNLFSVRGYAEAEFWFAAIKVVTVVVFIIIGIVVAAGGLGHKTYGFENWRIEGAPFYDGVPGVLATLVLTGYAFQGTEVIGITAGEAEDPVKTVPKAVRQVFWRIMIFYVSCIFLIGLIIPFNDPSLVGASTENIGQSPFTMVFKMAGLGPAADIMNAVILTTVLSAGNSCVYIATRTLWNLAMHGQAPAVFRKVTRRGIPIWCLALSLGVATGIFLLSLIGNQVVYTWILSLAGVTGFAAWAGISFSHLRFRKAYVRQGYDVRDLPYKALWYPFGPAFCLAIILVIILGQGWPSFAGGFHAQTFVSSYVSVPIILALYVAWKYAKKTKWVRPEQADIIRDSIFDPESDVYISGRNSKAAAVAHQSSFVSTASIKAEQSKPTML